MAQSLEGIAGSAAVARETSASGEAPEVPESVPKGLLIRLVRWMAWALPDSPELLSVTTRVFKVPR